MQELTPKNKIITGFKATDENMCCKGFQFKLGKWYTFKGELKLCKKGFHFCQYPSGPWSYYDFGRLFKVEVKQVFLSVGPGSDLKHVAKKIRLIEEIEIDGDRNTGNSNTGNSNTGNGNTGDGNTGDGNTGDRNTGYRNTGNSNTGDGNTGNGNCGNNHTGYLSTGEAPFYIFDLPAIKKDVDFELVNKLCDLMSQGNAFDYSEFLSLPNATLKKIKALHAMHKKERKGK